MQASMRELKARLSDYIRQAAAGETVTINIHNRPVAQIVPIKQTTNLDALTSTPGISWNGGKAVGLARGEVLAATVSLADMVLEDRR